MEDFKSVQGKVAVVTGGASGIGREIAKTFAENGMKVVIADIQDEKGEKIANGIKENGGEAIYVHTNVRNEEDLKNVVEKAVEKYGVINVMVNNAGVTPKGLHPTHEFDVEEFDRVNDINYKSVFFGTKHAVKAMMKSNAKNCSIINVASCSGLRSTEGFAFYDGSKHAAVGYTKATALDYAKHDITINAICPGVVNTEIFDGASDELMAYNRSLHPIGRLAEPKEIAWLALFLASNLARFITGAVINIDGGLLAGDKNSVTEWTEADPRF